MAGSCCPCACALFRRHRSSAASDTPASSAKPAAAGCRVCMCGCGCVGGGASRDEFNLKPKILKTSRDDLPWPGLAWHDGGLHAMAMCASVSMRSRAHTAQHSTGPKDPSWPHLPAHLPGQQQGCRQAPRPAALLQCHWHWRWPRQVVVVVACRARSLSAARRRGSCLHARHGWYSTSTSTKSHTIQAVHARM